MTRSIRRMPPGGSGGPGGPVGPVVGGRSASDKVNIQHFARRLNDLMTANGMTQSDVARAIWGETTNNQGYKVAKNRARVSAWLAGDNYPDAANLRKLSELLGVAVEDLAPDVVAATIDKEAPEVQLTAVSGHRDKAYLQINTLVSLRLAAEIIAMIERERAAQEAAEREARLRLVYHAPEQGAEPEAKAEGEQSAP